MLTSLTVWILALATQGQTKFGASASGDRMHKLRVSDPLAARTLSGQGAQLIADYGAFQLFRASSAVSGTVVSTAGVEDVTEQDVILLNAKRLDTTLPEIKALRTSAAVGEGKKLHLIQFAGPIRPEWEQELKQNAVTVITYIPNNTYLVYSKGTALSQMQSRAAGAGYVQWEGPYLDEFKIHPRARTVNAKGEPQKPDTDTFEIQMVADPAANALTLAVLERNKQAVIRQQSEFLGYLNVRVSLPAEDLGEIAAQPEVVSIQPYVEPRKRDERQDQIVAGNLSGSGPAGPGYLAWLTALGFSQAQFTASGFAVDVTDSGIDNGTIVPGHFGLYAGGDILQPSRVVYNRLEGTPHTGSTLQGCDGHGTLNSHIICGFNDAAAGFPHTDAEGFRYGLGVCPFVKVGSSVIFDPDSYTSPNLPNLQSKAHQSGARITSNSWGANTAGGYSADAQAYDALVRDAQPGGSTFPTSGNQEMVVVFAAGNAGPSASSVGAPGTAKNVITVGASENVRSMNLANGGNNASGNDGCSEPDTGADNADDIISFSSRGPCADGRRKPDLVGPGTHVTGGAAQNSPPPDPSGTGSALACFAGTGVCALPGGGTAGSANNFFPLGQQFYSVSSGTSHSTPALAGCCALVRQYFINNGLTPPSPAMTKAFLMNSTRYLTGVGANDSLWSNNQGMGEANLGMAFDGVARVLRDQVASDKFTASGQSRGWSGVVSDASKPFRVTLAWTDAPGSTTGNAYRNDLDLVVTVGGNTYKGNVFSGANSTTGGAADPRNNVESVFIPAGVSGSFHVAVTAANINSDGVPNEAPSLDQDSAIVIYNAIEIPTPVIGPGSATLATESCSPPNGVVDPGETVTMNFSLLNVGTSNTTSLVATLLAGNGVESPSGPQAYGALIAGGEAATQAFSFTATGACGAVISPTFHLQDGTTDLGNVSFSLQSGILATVLGEKFDSVTAPALPGGWTTAASGGEALWGTATSLADTAPNSAFTPDASTAGVNELVSPPITVSSTAAQLSFRHNYTTESGFDGCVLEISIGGGAFSDIILAGGSFVVGGYNGTINSGTANPLASRPGWTGTSGGFITTVVIMPPATVGQSVRFRWRLGSDASVGATGWYVDTISLAAPVCCGDASPPYAGYSAIPLSGVAPMVVTFTDTSIGAITNRYWDFGNGATTNTTATNFVFTYPSPGTFSVSLTAQGPYGSSTLTRPNYILAAGMLAANGSTLASEACANGGIDPGETVTVTFNLRNIGSVSTTNLVATLLASGGVTSPSGPQVFGAIPGGGSGSQPFTFVASGTCGGSLVATLQLQDGDTSHGAISFPLALGIMAAASSENFDAVVAPTVPAGWSTLASGGQTNWSTSTASNSSPPNAAFTFDAATAGVNELVSPVASIPVSGGQLSFRNNYNLEASTTSSSTYDGGVLEIKIGTGAFTDIITAGGSFVSGGYNRTISASSDPLNGRACWSGISGGFTNTVINLPSAAAGQTVQFKWRCGTDSSVSRPGWWIDDIAVSSLTCCDRTAPPKAGFVGGPLSGAAPLAVTFTDLSVGNITNRFWDFGNGVTSNTTATAVLCAYDSPGTFAVSLTATGPTGSNTLTRAAYVTVTNPAPALVADVFNLTAENCPNGAVDPAEIVTMSFGLRNNGTASTTNLVATLLPTGGITSPSGPQTYGALAAAGGAASQPFTFTASGACGGTNIATLQLQDGPIDLGTVAFAFGLGLAGPLAENFDGVAAPSLPTGWSTTASGAQSPWVTSATANHRAPNAAYSPDATAVGDNALVSPVIPLPSGPSQLLFWHKYDLEAGYDGGVLEISIGGGAFADILTAGGAFASGGYTRTISTSFSNPLAGRQAWSGTSAGFTNTIVDFPSAAAGQPVQVRWRCGTDSSAGNTGWYVDTVSIKSPICCTVIRPSLRLPRVDANQVFSCIVAGSPGIYVIESLTQTNWSPVGTVTNVTGEVPYSYSNAVDQVRLFRARWQP